MAIRSTPIITASADAIKPGKNDCIAKGIVAITPPIKRMVPTAPIRVLLFFTIFYRHLSARWNSKMARTHNAEI